LKLTTTCDLNTLELQYGGEAIEIKVRDIFENVLGKLAVVNAWFGERQLAVVSLPKDKPLFTDGHGNLYLCSNMDGIDSFVAGEVTFKRINLD